MTSNLNKVIILGSGSWGTALAYLASFNARDVILCSNDLRRAQMINDSSVNPDAFPLVKLPRNISAQAGIKGISEADILVIAVPAQFFRGALEIIKNDIKNYPKAHIVICSKGIEVNSKLLMSEIVKDIGLNNNIVIFSGPNFANEIIDNKSAACTLASINKEAMSITESAFAKDNFAVEKIADVIGLQICGAIKNVYAIVAGIAHGLNLGQNFHAVLMKKLLDELVTILMSIGANKDTAFSFGGISDLFLTCSSTTSRNFTFGKSLVEGKKIEQMLQEKTVEGYYTALALYEKLNIEKENNFNILRYIYEVLYNNANTSLIKELIR